MKSQLQLVCSLLPAVLVSITATCDAKEFATTGEIERIDPAFDKIVSSDAKIEVLAEGFTWSEGPVWVPQKDRIDGGYLLFSDVPNNVVHRWDEVDGLSTFLKPSGFTGKTTNANETGSNGLALDAKGRLVLCQHGDRRLARLKESLANPTPEYETLVNRFEGKRFHSPNDLVIHSSGEIYFTDPPYGLAKKWKDPSREMDFQGIYRLSADGSELSLLVSELHAPNGIAFSPDEKTLYVTQSHRPAPVVMAYLVREVRGKDDHSDFFIEAGRVFFDASELVKTRTGMPDGMKVDASGNVFATGPGGVLVISPEGKHLGSIRTGGVIANCAFGDDGKTLYMTSHERLCRVRVLTTGQGF
ncbi:SMP-30/gluconolactonase/LRE family protein [Adhaeretor mobilis]|uniref:Gluconolactonase n=1 Tax=Adhaeretor mobilis TaxID=1930276 RepID=A0A517MZN7_9BACT|nr:SMP-30/gluconolactonase/LRE family protein [Adhaeretor mobilis]QDT00352.1 Gluconolactonase precursor [Adhaeretor mobilis]